MPSQARLKFDENKLDIARLWTVHEEVAGAGPGRKHDVEILNRAAIVFITACWESFVEDLATEAFGFLLLEVPNALSVPSKVRDFATKPIFKQNDSRKVWDLADSGWRVLLANHRDVTLENWLGSFNTPKQAKVDTLFEDLLGLTKLSEAWRWQHMTPQEAGTKLDEYVTIRGNIAHRVHHDETVYKNWSTDYLAHIEHLVECSEEKVRGHLNATTGKNPW